MAVFGYTSRDVAEALNKLSTISAGRCGVDGVVSPGTSVDAATLQSYWQVVSNAATPSGAEPLGEATEHLSAIFTFVEGVMLSCGAPDSSFDIYEASFELLTKIGFFLQGVEAKDLLFRVLEHVNEVYDVLLSCVETYEWVENGVTGMLRLWMLQILFACCGTTVITGRDLMELTDNDVSGAISLISFLLRCDKAPFAMQATAGRCLVELTTADSVFMRCQQDDATDTQNTQIAKLTAMLNTHVNGLIKGIIQFDIVEAFGRCICQHQMSHERTDVVVKYFLTTIHNCLLYCSENQKRLRQHLATQSTIVQDIMVPYVNNILPALYDSPGCGPGMIEWQNLKSTLQTLVVVTFNINVFRPYLQDLDMMMRITGVPGILGHLSMLELLVKLAINIDFTKGPAGGEVFLNTLRTAFEQLPEDGQLRFQRRLTSAQSMRLPYSRTATKAMEAFSFVLVLPPGTEVSPEAVRSRKAQRKQRWRRSKNKARKRKRMFAMQAARGKDRSALAAPSDSEAAAEGGGEEQDGDEEEEEDSDEDMPPLIPVSGLDDQLGEADEVGVPSLAVCPLSGTLMHDPVQTPEGHVFERAALEDWVRSNGSNPLTGEALELEQCQPQAEIAATIQGFQMMQLSACQIAPEAFEEPLPEAAAMAAPLAPEPEPAGVGEARPASLLGDLPSLVTAQPAEPRKKAKSKIRIESRSVVDCPEEMRCTIDGKVCVNPVRSPYGHLFERKTLERWFMNCGSVCPVTQRPLRLEDCEPDADMKKRIVKFLKCQQ